MTSTAHPARPDGGILAADLLTAIERRLLDPLEILLQSPQEVAALRRRLQLLVAGWADDLLSDDGDTVAATAARLLAVLFDGDEFMPPATWWRSPFGRVVALRVGYPGARAVSGAQAAAMLGISRQGVHDLVRRGKLTAAEGGIDIRSVQERLAATW